MVTVRIKEQVCKQGSRYPSSRELDNLALGFHAKAAEEVCSYLRLLSLKIRIVGNTRNSSTSTPHFESSKGIRRLGPRGETSAIEVNG